MYVNPFDTFFEAKCNQLFKNEKLKGFQVRMEPDCALHGFWGGSGNSKLHTISEQSVIMGITGIQLEIPRSIRGRICKNEDFLIGLAKIIVEMYTEYIVPLWSMKQIPVTKPDLDLAGMVHE